MAEATKTTISKQITTTVEEEVILLKLTADEAKTLALISHFVAGSLMKSRRKHTDDIGAAVERCLPGFYYGDIRCEIDTNSEFRFRDR